MKDNMGNRKTITEIKERHSRLVSNLYLIINKEGKRNVKVMIKTLKEYLDNPNINLKYEIENAPEGQRKQNLKWINGDAV